MTDEELKRIAQRLGLPPSGLKRKIDILIDEKMHMEFLQVFAGKTVEDLKDASRRLSDKTRVCVLNENTTFKIGSKKKTKKKTTKKKAKKKT